MKRRTYYALQRTHQRFNRQQVIRAGIALLAAVVIGVGGYLAFFDSHSALANRLHHRARSRAGMASVITNTDPLFPGQFSTMAGTQIEGTGLRVLADQFAITSQDGSSSQANPPVNLAGAHLVGASDFSVTAQMDQLNGAATVQLYGQVPIIADEFRIERPSVQATVDGAQLIINIWDGSGQQPATSTFAIPAQTSAQLAISHNGNTLVFVLNGQTVGSLPDHGIFKAGTVWFGLNAARSSWLLSDLHVAGLNGKTVQVASGAALSVDTSTAASELQALAAAKRPGFTIGAAMALAPMVSDSEYAQVALSGSFGAMTTENALKWQFVEPQPGVYDFHEADALIIMAQQYHLAIQGHTLVFGEALPTWVQQLPVSSTADKQHVEQVMLDHITAVAGHYKGKMATWDVVNEPLADYDTFNANKGAIFRNHLWYKAMGQDYIAKAFQAAHQADPNALLFMNEYGLEENGDRWTAFLKLVTQLKQQGVPIDGVGFEAHVYAPEDKIDTTVLRQHIQQLAAIGVKARISEQDVYDDDGVTIQSQQYTNVLNACLSEPNCISWTTWGVSDRYDYFIDDDGSIQQGNDFLWDSSMNQTAAQKSLLQLLAK